MIVVISFDRRGWYYLLQRQPQHPKSFIKMGEEWLNSRAAAIGEKPVGDGLVPSQSPENRSPLSATARRRSTFIGSGQNRLLVWVRGVFSMGLDGLQHRRILWPQQHLMAISQTLA